LITASGTSAGAGMLRDLQLQQHAADEASLPLRIMHGVLRDISARLLLDAAHAAAMALLQPGSRWAGHMKVEEGRVLRPGFRVVYWLNTAVVPLTDPAGGPHGCVTRLCCWPVLLACAAGLCCWPVLLACAAGLCCWPVLLACAAGLCCWPVLDHPGGRSEGICNCTVAAAQLLARGAHISFASCSTCRSRAVLP
jgi:hypothetical protein